MITGTVKFFNDQKGFGFMSGLTEGQKVRFETDIDARNGKTAVSTIEAA